MRWNESAIRRVWMSLVPPGLYGDTIVTGREGHSAADSAEATKGRAEIAAVAARAANRNTRAASVDIVSPGIRGCEVGLSWRRASRTIGSSRASIGQTSR